MANILAYAQGLAYTLLNLMPTHYQRDSLQALVGLFLQAQGHPLPQHSKAKSVSDLSRFLALDEVAIKIKGSQGNRRVEWVKPEHPFTAISQSSEVHANHNEALWQCLETAV